MAHLLRDNLCDLGISLDDIGGDEGLQQLGNELWDYFLDWITFDGWSREETPRYRSDEDAKDIMQLYQDGWDRLLVYLARYKIPFKFELLDVELNRDAIRRFVVGAAAIILAKKDRAEYILHGQGQEFDEDLNLDLSIKDDQGMTLIHHAASHADCFLVAHAIFRGADVNALDNHGRTPVMRALDVHRRGPSNGTRFTIVDFFRNGVDLNLQDPARHGDTPLIALCDTNETDFDHDNNLQWLLLEFGADINGTNYKKRTPLIVAIRRCCKSRDEPELFSSQRNLVLFLLEQENIDVMLEDYKGYSALYWACFLGDADIFWKILCKYRYSSTTERQLRRCLRAIVYLLEVGAVRLVFSNRVSQIEQMKSQLLAFYRLVRFQLYIAKKLYTPESEYVPKKAKLWHTEATVSLFDKK
jgi:hypothetical protein